MNTRYASREIRWRALFLNTRSGCDEKLKHIPLIFYSSARDGNQIRRQARKVGGHSVVRKPADPARLLKTIDTVLNDSLIRTMVSAGQERFFNRRLETVPGIVGWTLIDISAGMTDLERQGKRNRWRKIRCSPVWLPGWSGPCCKAAISPTGPTYPGGVAVPGGYQVDGPGLNSDT